MHPSSPDLSRDSLYSAELALPLVRRGKVRDVFRSGTGLSDPLVIVASDRISAFDVVMPTPISGKGKILTAMAVFWLNFVAERGICATHLLSTKVSDVPAGAFGPGMTTRGDLEGRVMIGRACRVVPIECVVRGYLEGSGWKEYQATSSVCGVKLPAGLKQCDRLPEPIFTPATKEEQGKHDENISFERAGELVGRPLMEKLRELSLAIYTAAADHARARGIIIADTKFEFGIPAGDLAGDSASDSASETRPILIDEALTPDSSRFWPAETYAPGRPQKSFDKQFLREYLETLVTSGRWNKQSPGPELPAEVVAGTLERYGAALKLLTR